MRPRATVWPRVVTLVALVVGAVLLPVGGASGLVRQDAPADVSVALDETTRTVTAGADFGFGSTVRNDGPDPVDGLLAHLEIASTDPDVYVDPEDWSGERTRYLGPLAPGASVDLGWDVRAVGAGEFLVFVSVADEAGGRPVVSSRTLRLTVTQEQTLESSSALPVALGVPAAVLVVWGLVTRRRRRLR